jgi:hypothetical protein
VAGHNGFEKPPVAVVAIHSPQGLDANEDSGIDTTLKQNANMTNVDRENHLGSLPPQATAGAGGNTAAVEESVAREAQAAAATLVAQLAAAKATHTPLVVLSREGSAELNSLMIDSAIMQTHWVRARFVPAMVPATVVDSDVDESTGDVSDADTLFLGTIYDDDDLVTQWNDYRFGNDSHRENGRRRHTRMFVAVISISICVFIFTLFQRSRVSQVGAPITLQHLRFLSLVAVPIWLSRSVLLCSCGLCDALSLSRSQCLSRACPLSLSLSQQVPIVRQV